MRCPLTCESSRAVIKKLACLVDNTISVDAIEWLCLKVSIYILVRQKQEAQFSLEQLVTPNRLEGYLTSLGLIYRFLALDRSDKTMELMESYSQREIADQLPALAAALLDVASRGS